MFSKENNNIRYWFDVTFKIKYVVDEEDREVPEYQSTKLYIYNNHKNLVEINLDRSDIKQKPAKLIYRFNNITNSSYKAKRLKNDLNMFIGNKDYYNKNPLELKISNYMLKITLHIILWIHLGIQSLVFTWPFYLPFQILLLFS